MGRKMLSIPLRGDLQRTPTTSVHVARGKRVGKENARDDQKTKERKGPWCNFSRKTHSLACEKKRGRMRSKSRLSQYYECPGVEPRGKQSRGGGVQ